MSSLSVGQVSRLQPVCLSQHVSVRSPARPLFTSSCPSAGPLNASNSCSRPRRGVRQSCSTNTSASSSSAFSEDPDFFDRKEEAAVLFKILGSTPSSVSVVVGPRSSGKTALLKRVAARHYGKELSAFPHRRPPGWLDGRKAELGSPRAMAQALLGMVSEKGSLLESVKQFSIGGGAGGTTFSFGFTQVDPKVVDMTDVKSAVQSTEELFNQYTQQKRPEDPFPLLVVDEANRMKGWVSEPERSDIMAFLVNTAKVDRSAHIILATSDYPFLTWIRKELSSSNIKIFVLGELPKDEAKEFLTTKVLPPDTTVDDKEWDRIYQVCGGNAGLLTRTGTEFTIAQDWEKSLKSVMQPILMDVEEAMSGKDFGDGEAYTPEQLKKVAQMLLDAPPYHAVEWDVLAREVGGVGAAEHLSANDTNLRGEKALSTMVRADVLAFRPESDLARDLPSQSGIVATALTPGHLEAMRILKQRGKL